MNGMLAGCARGAADRRGPGGPRVDGRVARNWSRAATKSRTVVRIGALEARGSAVAAQSGALGDEIRVVNADSKRALKGASPAKAKSEVIRTLTLNALYVSPEES